MRFGFRVPSLRKRIAARTSWKRVVRNSLDLKAPRGWGWITNLRRAAYNRIYNRTTVGLGKGCVVVLLLAGFATSAVTWAALTVTADRPFDHGLKRKSTRTGTNASRARPSW